MKMLCQRERSKCSGQTDPGNFGRLGRRADSTRAGGQVQTFCIFRRSMIWRSRSFPDCRVRSCGSALVDTIKVKFRLLKLISSQNAIASSHSVKVFVMFLLLQSLVFPVIWGVFPQPRGLPASDKAETARAAQDGKRNQCSPGPAWAVPLSSLAFLLEVNPRSSDLQRFQVLN